MKSKHLTSPDCLPPRRVKLLFPDPFLDSADLAARWEPENGPIRGQYSGHVTIVDQSEFSIQVTWSITSLATTEFILMESPRPLTWGKFRKCCWVFAPLIDNSSHNNMLLLLTDAWLVTDHPYCCCCCCCAVALGAFQLYQSHNSMSKVQVRIPLITNRRKDRRTDILTPWAPNGAKNHLGCTPVLKPKSSCMNCTKVLSMDSFCSWAI